MHEKLKGIIDIIIKILPLILVSLLMISCLFLVNQCSQVDYTVQDVHKWCCQNINVTTSPTGEDCSTVINEIYGSTC